MRVDFYHLAASPLERILPRVCEKLLADKERLLIVADMAAIARLDEQLWDYDPAAFLPHGRSGGAGDVDQPILLSETADPANQAANIALADGLWRDEALGFERAFYFFDGGQIDDARNAWRALKDREGVERHYWKQDEGGKWVEGP